MPLIEPAMPPDEEFSRSFSILKRRKRKKKKTRTQNERTTFVLCCVFSVLHDLSLQSTPPSPRTDGNNSNQQEGTVQTQVHLGGKPCALSGWRVCFFFFIFFLSMRFFSSPLNCPFLFISMGGTLGAVITCPLEVIKTRMQVPIDFCFCGFFFFFYCFSNEC
jgi:hypothetical protein